MTRLLCLLLCHRFDIVRIFAWRGGLGGQLRCARCQRTFYGALSGGKFRLTDWSRGRAVFAAWDAGLLR